jgi:succinoglycan biosynthesis protein ExoA
MSRLNIIDFMLDPFKDEYISTVSLAIPAYNESKYIEHLIRSFLSTKYTNLLEIIVADGGSTDGTQDIVKALSLDDPRVRIINNPYKVQSVGLNLIFKETRGNVFLRADAHSDYAPDYIEKCVEALAESKALNVGGAQRFVAKTAFQAGLSLASYSILGTGGAKYRNPEYRGYAETVYLGCFVKEALLEASRSHIEIPASSSNPPGYPFDTQQITNQDAELNQRLLKLSPNAIYISPDIKTWYYPRSSWKSLFIQYFKYGRGRCLTNQKHQTMRISRGDIPFLCILSLILLGLVSVIVNPLLPLLISLLIISITAPFLEGLRIVLKYRDSFKDLIWRGEQHMIPSISSRWFICSIVILTMPIAHFLGYTYQIFRLKILRKSSW